MTGPRTFRLALSWLALVALIDVAAAQALKDSSNKPAADPTRTTPATDLRNTPPMVFVIAKGEADSCGPGCTEWIAADGAIDAGAPQRLRALINKIDKTGRRKLPPIYFHSPGGSVSAAMEIGRVMRGLRMRAGVARTLAPGCDANLSGDKTCDGILRSGRELTAELRTNRAVCASACVYALLGATEREVAPGAALGIHSIAITRTMIRKNGEGRILSTSRTRIIGNVAEIRQAHSRVARYAGEMGIDRGLITLASAVPFERVRVLTRDEIADFGIDTREVAESRWAREEDRRGRFGVVKFVASANGGEPKQYRTSLLRLSCSASKQVIVMFARERAQSDKIRSISLVAGKNEIVLKSQGKPAAGGSGVETELRAGFAASAYFEEAAKRDSIELVETPDGASPDSSVRRMALSTAGLASSLKTLPEQCY